MNPLQNLSDILKNIDARMKAPVSRRDRFEREMERKLGSIWNTQRAELMRLLGDPPSLANVPESYWNNGGAAIRKVINPIFEKVFIQQAEAVLNQLHLAVDWTLINKRAAEWALANTRHFLTGYEETNKRVIADYINKFFSDGWTLDDVIDHINAALFDPRRAQTIAITEITRAAVNAELSTVNLLESEYSNLHFKAYWITANDDRVCDICGPKHMKVIDDGDFPPAHPNCRCEVFYDMMVDKP